MIEAAPLSPPRSVRSSHLRRATAPIEPLPATSAAHVLILFRSSHAPVNPHCAVGLGVNALHTVRVLRRHGVDARAYGVWKPEDVHARLESHPKTTHCILEAPWVPLDAMHVLLAAFPDVHFVVRSHSQIGFLQVEAGAIRLIRELMIEQDGVTNLAVATNSKRLALFIEETYDGPCLFLPNLYDLERAKRKHRPPHDHRALRIGSFGALRLLKNHTTAAAAALLVARERRCDLEFWVNDDRDPHGVGILHALRAMFDGLHWAKLVEAPWADWAGFRRCVAHMDLCMQLSATETFNLTTADATSEGVASVVTPVVEWAPDYWKVDTDAVEDAARVAGHLLSSPTAAHDGIVSLQRFVEGAVHDWLRYFSAPQGA